MKKIILLVRVSTKYQTYDAQKQELIEYAKRDGYSENDMEIIEDKESATKLSDEERQGLNKMYVAINNPDNQIEAVYCWELSRLSRLPVSLYKVRDELLNKKIDLRTKYENFKLLNEKKELDPNSNIMLGFYISMCENEIRQKVERTKRIKIQKAKEGKYTGGLIKFGYSCDEKTKEYIINEEEATVIRAVFSLYETGKYGLNTLYKEMIKRGYKVIIHQINRILTSPEYIGGIRPEYIEVIKRKKQKTDRIIHRYDRYYPTIIDKTQYDKCREIANQNNTNIDKSKNIYYAHKLIKCSSCGAYLVAAKHTVQYQCPKKYSPLSKVECSGTDRININIIDSILWNVAVQIEIDFIFNYSEKQLEGWKNEILELQEKIDNSENQYNTILGNERKKLRKAISVETMNDKELEAIATKQTKSDKQKIEKEKVYYKQEIDRLNNLITEANTLYNSTFTIPEYESTFVNKMENITKMVENTDDKQRYDVIHKHIKQVSISNIPESTPTKRIDVICYNGETETYYYATKIMDREKKIYKVIEVDNEFNFKEYYSFKERYIRPY